MTLWSRFISTVGGTGFISALGGLYIVLGAVQVRRDVMSNGPLGEILVDSILFAFPALVLLYSGYWIRGSGLHPELYPRIAGWCVGGMAIMLSATGLLVLNPDASLGHPVRELGIHMGVGTVGGLGVGVMEARALTRAAEAERNERVLRKERNFVEQLIETAPIGIATLDHEGRFDYLNDQIEDIFGYPQDVIGDYEKRTDLFDLIGPDGTRLSPEEIPAYRIMENGETVHEGPIGLEGPDGQRVWLLVSGKPIEDDEGRKAVLTYTDITEQVEYERKLEESNERLERFAYAASHDLQEPLRMVSSYIRMLENRYADEFDDDGREFVEFAVDGADRMRNMIDGLLQYSRVDSRGNPFEPVDLDDVFEDVCDDLRIAIEESDAEITTDSLPIVHGDEEQLRQVFQNLLDNAIEYSGDDTPQIHVSVERNGEWWTIGVHDDGIGIDPDDADSVFDIFHRLHSHDEHPGTGIGLALCDRIVERHGGDIWVDSEPGEGSTFSVTLPAAEQQSASVVQSPSREEQKKGQID